MRIQQLRCFLIGGVTLLGVTNASPAHAQIFSKAAQALVRIPDPLGLPDDIVRERISEHRLHHRQAQLQKDLTQGNTASVNRDLKRIASEERLLEIYRWDIRRDSLQAPGPYPTFRRQEAPASTSNATATAISTATASKVPITIGNAGPSGANVDFTIDGATYKAASGRIQQLEVAPTSVVTYDRGGPSAGSQRYALSAGTYEFRPSDGGWALYKLPETPATIPR